MPSENLRGNVIGSTNGRISHDSSRFTPIVNDTSITDSKIDLIKIDGVAVTRLVGLALEELLVVRVVMKLMEAS